MKPIEENILSNSMHSFRVNRSKLSYFDNPWHYHSAYELLYIIKSEGKRFVGDSIDNFYPGDMVLIGPGLPHVWKNNPEYYEGNTDLTAEAIVLQFNKDAFGESFFDLPELQLIKQLLKNSQRGLQIVGDTRDAIIPMLYELIELKGFARLNRMLNILQLLSESIELRPLTTKSFEKALYSYKSDVMNRVFEFVANNYKNDISLNEVAIVANMSKTAFCRFFKTRSFKTFSDYLNEVRINYACKLLIEGKLSISEVCFECGYNSTSYFSRQFRKIKNQTPLEYYKIYKRVIV